MSAKHQSLAIIPCGKAKIWDQEPEIGAVPAAEDYPSTFHRLCREYARAVADEWLVLSAKYGFLRPDDPVGGAFEGTGVSLERPLSGLGGMGKMQAWLK